ncbi:hypothetical protein M758_UG275300 [Ceratodon purpureus]|nr:hypothetical protein M758_UG275300 [Ceratodon purpureus]
MKCESPTYLLKQEVDSLAHKLQIRDLFIEYLLRQSLQRSHTRIHQLNKNHTNKNPQQHRKTYTKIRMRSTKVQHFVDGLAQPRRHGSLLLSLHSTMSPLKTEPKISTRS